MKLIWIEGTSGEVREVAHAMIIPSGSELLGVVLDRPEMPLPEIKPDRPKIAADNGHVAAKPEPTRRTVAARTPVLNREPRQLKSPVAAKKARSEEWKEQQSARMKDIAAKRQTARPVSEIDAEVMAAIADGCDKIGNIHTHTKISWGTVSNSVSRLISAGRIEETDEGLVAL